MTSANLPKQRFWLAGKREPAQDLFFKESLDQSRWQPGDADNWDTCWYTGMPAPDVFEKLTAGKTINHIPGNSSLTIKSNLHATLAAARERMVEQDGGTGDQAKRLNFFPRIYSMPTQYHALQEAAAADPGKRWILKPKNSARGKGIQMVRDIATVPLGNTWMVQEYIDNPHTMNGHKYVLRLYVLISSVEPLRVYLYNEGSAKLASAIYDLEDLGNLYAHLTNPDLNANNRDTESPVVFHSLGKYRAWLRHEGHDDEALFERIRDMVTLTMIAAREQMRSRVRAVSADTSGCYELLGLDCLVDSNLKPWILECNLSPSLDICAAPRDGGDVEARNKRQLIVDMVQLLGLNEPSIDRSGLHPADRIRAEAEAELARTGDFTRIFPAHDVARYLPFFPLPRLADMVLADAVADTPLARPTVIPRHTAELISDDRLSLYAEATGTLYAPNSSAAWIWLKAGDGANPDAMADELLASQPRNGSRAGGDWLIRREVWDMLADWAASGMLLQRPDSRSAPRAETADDASERGQSLNQPSPAPDEIGLQVGAAALRLWPGHRLVAGRLQSAFSPLAVPHADGECLEILQSAAGYAIAGGGRLLADGLTLARIGPVLCRVLQERSVRGQHECAMAGMLIPLGDAKGQDNNGNHVPAAFLPQHADGGWDVLALCLAALVGHGHAGGIRLALGAPGAVVPVGLPARVAEDDAERLAALARNEQTADALRHLHEWASGARGYLVPATRAALSRTYQVSTVIVPTRAKRAPGESLAKRIPEHEALAALLPSAVNGAGGSLRADAVGKLGEWLAERRLWSLDMSDLVAGVDALTGDVLANHPGGSVAAS